MEEVEERWWVMSNSDFYEAMKRAHAGEEPDLLLIEYYVNSESEKVDPDD